MSDQPRPQSEKRTALGRGLSALIPDGPALSREAPDPTELDIDLLAPNPRQPRLSLDETRLDELATSIKANGIVQPILVRRKGVTYEIVAGERRWRAAQRAGLLKVPVVLRDVPDDKLLEVALIENIQRENLNPIDEALAYKRLIDEAGLTQDRLASAVGKDRASIANHLRLLKLPDGVRSLVAAGTLSVGHAKALLSLDNEDRVEPTAELMIKRGLSVREAEVLVRHINNPPPKPSDIPKDVHVRQAEEKLRLALGTRVRIVKKAKGGRLEIEFVSEEELQRLYEHLTER